jgi:hypothetical protein
VKTNATSGVTIEFDAPWTVSLAGGYDPISGVMVTSNVDYTLTDPDGIFGGGGPANTDVVVDVTGNVVFATVVPVPSAVIAGVSLLGSMGLVKGRARLAGLLK